MRSQASPSQWCMFILSTFCQKCTWKKPTKTKTARKKFGPLFTLFLGDVQVHPLVTKNDPCPFSTFGRQQYNFFSDYGRVRAVLVSHQLRKIGLEWVQIRTIISASYVSQFTKEPQIEAELLPASTSCTQLNRRKHHTLYM